MPSKNLVWLKKNYLHRIRKTEIMAATFPKIFEILSKNRGRWVQSFKISTLKILVITIVTQAHLFWRGSYQIEQAMQWQVQYSHGRCHHNFAKLGLLHRLKRKATKRYMSHIAYLWEFSTEIIITCWMYPNLIHRSSMMMWPISCYSHAKHKKLLINRFRENIKNTKFLRFIPQ